jgi:hypothetical protein
MTKKIIPFTQNKKNISPNDYCKSFHMWPTNWMGTDEDIETGNKILVGITPFILHLHHSGLSKKSIVKHMDNLWILGSQIIREINYYDEKKYRKLNPQKLLLEYVTSEGGPLPSSIGLNNETSIKSYDSTCKKLYTFILN